MKKGERVATSVSLTTTLGVVGKGCRVAIAITLGPVESSPDQGCAKLPVCIVLGCRTRPLFSLLLSVNPQRVQLCVLGPKWSSPERLKRTIHKSKLST